MVDFSEISRKVLDTLESWDILKEDHDGPTAALLIESILMEHREELEAEEIEQLIPITGSPIDVTDEIISWGNKEVDSSFSVGSIACSGRPHEPCEAYRAEVLW